MTGPLDDQDREFLKEMSTPAFVEAVWRCGAKTISYAPHCPSWRRDRETFIGYDDCPDCKGGGRKVISREMGSGGSYPVNCPLCLAKHTDDPIRKRRSERLRKIQSVFNKTFLWWIEGWKEEDRREICEVLTEKWIEIIKRFTEKPVANSPETVKVKE